MIMLTLSGPSTYYDYRGKHLGTQFLLCQKFANKIGVSLRVELCRDTLEMLAKLKAGEADIIGVPLPPPYLSAHQVKGECRFVPCGPQIGTDSGRWVVTSSQPALAKALDDWYRPSLLTDAEREETFLLSSKSIRRHVYAPMQNRRKGIISDYDGLFIKHSRNIRWDWRLLAAQCYQESTFDPRARSWAGACGLMQIMPSTAQHLRLPEAQLFAPEANIAAATRYLGEIENKFNDISNRHERIKFVLASYNGGYHHIRDAMSLAAKNGKDPRKWNEVAKFVLLLREPEYYRDPAVKYGYMRGHETVDYVEKIQQRWQQYKGVSKSTVGTSVLTPRKAKRNKPKYKLSPSDNET